MEEKKETIKHPENGETLEEKVCLYCRKQIYENKVGAPYNQDFSSHRCRL